MVNNEQLNLFVELCTKRDDGLLSWQEVADKMNSLVDEDFGKDKWRKDWASFKQGIEYARANSGNSELDELEERRIALEIEKKKKQVASTNFNSLIREQARREMLFDEFRRAIGTVQAPKFNALPISTGFKDCILGISDIHYGKQFKSVNNEYNEQIAIQRMEQVMSEAIDYCKKNGIDHVHIVNNGDSVEGMSLRISQLQSLQLGFVDQIVRFERMMVEWLNEFSKSVRLTYHHTPSANHTEIRPLGTKAGAFPDQDVEKIMIAYIHDMLAKNERINMPEYQQDYCRFKVFDYLFYAKHGHQTFNVKTYLRDLSMLHGEFISYLITGHRHFSDEITVGTIENINQKILQLPSLMGSDEYSDSLLTGSKAGASIFVVQDKKGKTDTHDIVLN